MAGSIKINASPTARLRWEGAPDLYPTEVHLRLTPTSEALISDKTPLCLPVTDVGRFSTLEHIGFQWNSKGFGPLYKSATSSNAFLDIPAISLVVDAASVDPRGTIWARADYAWEVLPPLLISQLRTNTDEEIPNFYKGSDGSRKLSERDRNGKQVLHVAMQLGEGGELNGCWFLNTRLRASYGSYADPELFLYGGSASVYQTKRDTVSVGANGITLDIFRSYPEELVLVDASATQVVSNVSDNLDLQAPTIEQESEIVWHYPNENYREFFNRNHDEYYPSVPDGEFPHAVASGNHSHGRVFYDPLNTFEWENAMMTGEILLRHAITEWIPWKALGPIVGILGLTAPEQITRRSHAISVNFDLAWNDNLSRWWNDATDEYNLPKPANANIRHYWMTVAGQIPYICRAFHTDKYNESGYVGDEVMKFAKATGLPRSVGYFKKDPQY